MTSYLLDTNHVSALFKNDLKVIGRVSASQIDRFGVSVPTIAELWYMVFNSSRVAANASRLGEVLRDFERWDFTELAANEFGRLKAELRRQWRPIPDIDVQIAAIARLNGLTLLTDDAHFSSVSGLKLDNWVR
jgi:tRNA(fMet)-specific endonuclease VapC